MIYQHVERNFFRVKNIVPSCFEGTVNGKYPNNGICVRHPKSKVHYRKMWTIQNRIWAQKLQNVNRLYCMAGFLWTSFLPYPSYKIYYGTLPNSILNTADAKFIIKNKRTWHQEHNTISEVKLIHCFCSPTSVSHPTIHSWSFCLLLVLCASIPNSRRLGQSQEHSGAPWSPSSVTQFWCSSIPASVPGQCRQ